MLKPILSEAINEVNARAWAKERGISVVETVSSRDRSYSNLISLQLRSADQTEWVEGAILRQGNPRLVSIDGIAVESQLNGTMLFIRNEDKPGVIGSVGTILGESNINIASFVLGRSPDKPAGSRRGEHGFGRPGRLASRKSGRFRPSGLRKSSAFSCRTGGRPTSPLILRDSSPVYSG